MTPLTDEERASRPMNLEEVMEYLRIGRNAALRLFQSGAIGGRKAGREWRTSRAAIDRWLEGGGNPEDKPE